MQLACETNCIPVLQTFEAAHEGRSPSRLALIHSTPWTHASLSAPATHNRSKDLSIRGKWSLACKPTLDLSCEHLFACDDFYHSLP